MELQPIQSLIYELRGYNVMLDSDLAAMYEVETRVLNQAVKRNIRRFPYDFMFQLTTEEWENLKSQILKSQFVISSWGGTRKLPFAFTEQGIAMLSGVLNSDVAIDANIKIMRAFVAIRQMVINQSMQSNVKELQQEMAELKRHVEETFTDYNTTNEDTRQQLEQINLLFTELTQRLPAKPRRKIGFFTEEQRKNNEDIIK